MIKATDYIKTAFSANDAEELGQAISPLLDGLEKIVVDFDGITIFTTLFFNNAFAKFLMEIGPKKYNERFCLKNLTELGESTYKHSIENAVKFYNLSKEEQKKQEEILENPED